MKGLVAALALLPVSFAPNAGWHAGHGREQCLCGSDRVALRAGQYVDGNRALARVWRVPAPRDDRSLPPDGIALQVTAAIDIRPSLRGPFLAADDPRR